MPFMLFTKIPLIWGVYVGLVIGCIAELGQILSAFTSLENLISFAVTSLAILSLVIALVKKEEIIWRKILLILFCVQWLVYTSAGIVGFILNGFHNGYLIFFCIFSVFVTFFFFVFYYWLKEGQME